MNTSFSLYHARSETTRGRESRIPRFVMRMRFQLPMALLLCVVVPVLLRGQYPIFGRMPDTVFHAATGSSIAVIATFILVRRLYSFPGIQMGAYTLVTVSLPYAALAITFLVFRFEYSRFILIASYVFALGWFTVIQWINERVVRPHLAVVPGGNADDVLEISSVRWTSLPAPDSPLPHVAGIVADLRADLSDEWEQFLADTTLRGVPVYHTKQVVESLTGRVQIEHLSENTFGSLLPNLIYIQAKQVIDWVAALILLPFFGVVLAVVGPLIRLTSDGPVLFRQPRVGYRGQEIIVYKFRTMTDIKSGHGDREAAQTKDDDGRITSVGKVLRKYRIDELPQIINILKGEMSWIGPRPEAVPLSVWYEEELPFYRYRHVVRPGISGWAQVNQGHVVASDDVLEKLYYDFFYIKYLSFWLDCLIVLRTIETMIRGFGSK